MAEDKIKPLIKQIQMILLEQGINPGPIDGIYGGKTAKALEKYQARGVRPITPAVIKSIPNPNKPPLTKVPVKSNVEAMRPKKDWVLAKALVTLREQLNVTYPKRNKKSDGAIGDAAHAVRTSDHNPWVVHPVTKQPTVTALDITHDPANGVNCTAIANAISDDPRVKYIIWNGRIFTPAKSAKWTKYTGTNPHTSHIHISVLSNVEHFDNGDIWDLNQ